MLGERAKPEKYHIITAGRIADLLVPEIRDKRGKYVVCIAGESGAGKTVIAGELKKAIDRNGLKTRIFQQDDYFTRPPGTNYRLRRKDLSVVGVQEVNISLLQEHVDSFIRDSGTVVQKPLIDFTGNSIGKEHVDFKMFDVLIVEGTYVFLIQNADKRIYLGKTYAETSGSRLLRGRDKIDTFDKEILAIEHKIIAGHRKKADIVVDSDYNVRVIR